MNKLFTIYRYRKQYYAFCFDTEIQNHCENFMVWHFPTIKYWMASEDMFQNAEANLSVDTEYPHNYLIHGKMLHVSNVHVHKNGLRFTL